MATFFDMFGPQMNQQQFLSGAIPELIASGLGPAVLENFLELARQACGEAQAQSSGFSAQQTSTSSASATKFVRRQDGQEVACQLVLPEPFEAGEVSVSLTEDEKSVKISARHEYAEGNFEWTHSVALPANAEAAGLAAKVLPAQMCFRRPVVQLTCPVVVEEKEKKEEPKSARGQTAIPIKIQRATPKEPSGTNAEQNAETTDKKMYPEPEIKMD